MRELMLRSVEEINKEKLSRRGPAEEKTIAAYQRSRWTAPERSLGSRGISTTEE
jgi:hypothetical protein